MLKKLGTNKNAKTNFLISTQKRYKKIQRQPATRRNRGIRRTSRTNHNLFRNEIPSQQKQLQQPQLHRKIQTNTKTDFLKMKAFTSKLIVPVFFNILLTSNHSNADGSLQEGSLSIVLINYICDYLIKPAHCNLTMFENEIFECQLPFKFSIKDKAFFLPYFNDDCWNLIFFNTKTSGYCYISNTINRNLQQFSKFIDKYNESVINHKLRPFENWKL